MTEPHPRGRRFLQWGTIFGLCVAAGASPTIAVDRPQIRACFRTAPGFFERNAALVTSGLEDDILKSFAAAIGADLVLEEAPSFAELLKMAELGRCDIAAARMSVTEERRKRLAFTTPYFPNRVLVVQRTQGTLAKLEDLQNRTVAVEGATHPAKLLSQVSGVKAVNVDNDAALFEVVSKGQADALACDSAVVLRHMARSPGFSVAFPLGEREFFAFGLPLKSIWTDRLNNHLKSIAKTGAFEKMLAKHFGAGNAEFLASEVKAETAGR